MRSRYLARPVKHSLATARMNPKTGENIWYSNWAGNNWKHYYLMDMFGRTPLNQTIPKYDLEFQYLESNPSLHNFPSNHLWWGRCEVFQICQTLRSTFRTLGFCGTMQGVEASAFTIFRPSGNQTWQWNIQPCCPMLLSTFRLAQREDVQGHGFPTSVTQTARPGKDQDLIRLGDGSGVCWQIFVDILYKINW